MLYIFIIGEIWFGIIFPAFHAILIRYGHNQNWIMKRPQCVKCHLYWSLRTIINIPFVESKDSATIQLNVAFYSRLDGMCQNIKCSLTFIISFLTKFTECAIRTRITKFQPRTELNVVNRKIYNRQKLCQWWTKTNVIFEIHFLLILLRYALNFRLNNQSRNTSKYKVWLIINVYSVYKYISVHWPINRDERRFSPVAQHLKFCTLIRTIWVSFIFKNKKFVFSFFFGLHTHCRRCLLVSGQRWAIWKFRQTEMKIRKMKWEKLMRLDIIFCETLFHFNGEWNKFCRRICEWKKWEMLALMI